VVQDHRLFGSLESRLERNKEGERSSAPGFQPFPGQVLGFKETISHKCGAVRGGLVCKAHRLLEHSTLGSRVIKKEREGSAPGFQPIPG